MSIPLHQIGFEKISVERVIDFLPYPFLVAEVKDDIPKTVFINQKFTEEIGYNIDEIPTINEWFQKAYPQTEYRNEVINVWNERATYALRNNQTFVTMKACITSKASKNIWYDVKSSFIGPLHFVAFINIDDNILKEQELQRLNDNKNRILSILSHDLRNPLFNLQSLIHLTLTSSLSPGDFMNSVQNVSHRVFQLLEFVDTTLHWTKTNFDQFTIDIQNVDLFKVARTTLETYETAYTSKKIKIVIADTGDAVAETDPEILTIVIRNLLSNAIKFTPDNGSISIAVKDEGDSIIFLMKDSGIGMTSETIADILKDHYVSNKGTREEKGLGIGLKLCRDLLRKIGGELKIQSERGKGTLMKIVLKKRIGLIETFNK